MGFQKQSGKAFEYATLQALRICLGKNNSVIIENPATKVASEDFETLSDERQQENLQAGAAAASLLLKFEPHLCLACQGKYAVNITLQSDQAGALGDVRDLLISIPELNWEIGISAKHQHEALKHSRLSNHIDFGEKWFGIPCSKDYFDVIGPVFDRLKELRSRRLSWSQLPDKNIKIYTPILLAFQNELLSLDKQHPRAIARGLVSYLIGHKDFYKVVKLKRQTKVQVFNFNETLNKSIHGIQPDVRLEKLRLPSRIVEIDFRQGELEASSTTLDMICDAGWQLSFRLHNASTLVEASLKFDVNLIGRPNNLQTFTAAW